MCIFRRLLSKARFVDSSKIFSQELEITMAKDACYLFRKKANAKKKKKKETLLTPLHLECQNTSQCGQKLFRYTVRNFSFLQTWVKGRLKPCIFVVLVFSLSSSHSLLTWKITTSSELSHSIVLRWIKL